MSPAIVMPLLLFSSVASSLLLVGEANLVLQILMIVLGIAHLHYTMKTKQQERAWAEEDRKRAEAAKAAAELAALEAKASRAEAKESRVEAIKAREVLGKMITENTEITRTGNNKDQIVAMTLSIFDKMAARVGVSPEIEQEARALKDAGREIGAQAAYPPPDEGPPQSVSPLGSGSGQGSPGEGDDRGVGTSDGTDPGDC